MMRRPFSQPFITTDEEKNNRKKAFFIDIYNK
jgi:hypothetical protein